MASGGGFGGFGGFGGGFACGNFHSHHPTLYRPGPPLTAIDRFLVGQGQGQGQSHFPGRSSGGNVVSGNGFHDFCSGAGAIGSCGGGFPWQILGDVGLHLKEKSRPEVCDHGGAGEGKLTKRSARGSDGGGKRAKGGASATLIKGQWGAEEDRKLLRLVEEFGDKKWAQIAKKIGGRAGKQCRERWHNHLRPDIRKDEWDEEEERILIEWHMKVGNKWAEIAKRIVGRTENTIKNHFNATKRRQDSRKKTNKDDQKPHSTLLQDYIKSNKLDLKWTTAATAAAAAPTQNGGAAATPTSSTISEDPPTGQYLYKGCFLQDYSDLTTAVVHDSPPSLMTSHTCDEELLFMQNLFPSTCISTSNNPAPIFGVASENIAGSMAPPPSSSSSSSTHLYSDTYISNLLNGTSSSTPSSASIDHHHHHHHQYYSCDMNSPMNMEFLQGDQASPSGKREMDLIEMLSSCSRYGNQDDSATDF